MLAGNAANSTSEVAAMEVSTSPHVMAEEEAAKAVQKRYEGLVMVRNKAMKGKGAWYWAHLEPFLVHHSDSGLPKAVKLKCRLCAAVFSASNPSRTASEHLKRGTCPNFSTKADSPHPISTLLPPSDSPASNRRKRSSATAAEPSQSYSASPLTMIEPSRYYHDVNFPHSPASVPALVSPSTAIVVAGADSSAYPHQPPSMLSGGKEDLVPLAMFENSVKRLKSPKNLPVVPTLTKSQIEFAFDCLSDWVYESCGSISFSSLQHPKFKSFLTQLSLPPVSRTHFSSSKLDSKYQQAKNEADARIRESVFFQIASDGWKKKQSSIDEHLINLTVNLSNGTTVFQKAVFSGCSQLPSKYVEEVLLDSIKEICGSSVQKCVGIVGDRFKNKALRNLESQDPWMVNLSCQCQGFLSLIKDLYKELPLIMNVSKCCLEIAGFVNNKTQVRNCFRKHQIHEYGYSALLRMPSNEVMNFEQAFAMVGDIMGSARALQSLVLDESFKMVSMEDPVSREFVEMIRNVKFWNDLEAVRSIVKLIKEMANEIETEKPLIGQCLPLWEELKASLKDWCVKFRVSYGDLERIYEKRFKKNYHPAWAAAYILDPLYLIRDSSGKYIPPFKNLTPQQEKDINKLINRLLPMEEAHIALMELMEWRNEGLDPVYAQAVQLKERDSVTGKLKIASPRSSMLVWETNILEFSSLWKIAVRLIFLHATSRGFKCNSGFLRQVNSVGNDRAGFDKAHKMIFIAANSKLKRRDLSTEDDKDIELFANGNENVLNEVYC